MSLAYAEDPDHIRNLNHIIRASQHKHLTTPVRANLPVRGWIDHGDAGGRLTVFAMYFHAQGPAYKGPGELLSAFDSANYRPSYVTQVFNKGKSKSMLEQAEYEASTKPGGCVGVCGCGCGWLLRVVMAVVVVLVAVVLV